MYVVGIIVSLESLLIALKYYMYVSLIEFYKPRSIVFMSVCKELLAVGSSF